MTLVKWSMLIYGVLMIALGAEAFAAKHSVMSLIGGGGIGLIVIGMMALSFTKPRLAYIVSMIAALAMIGQFGPKMLTQPMPWQAPAIAGLSLALILVLGSGHVISMAAKKKESA